MAEAEAQVAAMVRVLASAPHHFAAPWGPDVRQDVVLAAMIDGVYNPIAALPQALPHGRLRPLLRALTPVAQAVLDLEPQLRRQLAGTRPDDLGGLMRLISQAAAGAYAVGAGLNVPLLRCSRAAAEGGLLSSMFRGAAGMADVGMEAAAAAVSAALEQAGRAEGGAAADDALGTLRRRLPFLLGLLSRSMDGTESFPDGSPGVRCLEELGRGLWEPEPLLAAVMRAARLLEALLQKPSDGGQWQLLTAAAKLLKAAAEQQGHPASLRQIARPSVEQYQALSSLAVLLLERLLDAKDSSAGAGSSGGSAGVQQAWRMAWWLAGNGAFLLASGPESAGPGFAGSVRPLARLAERAAAAYTALMADAPADAPSSVLAEAAVVARLGLVAFGVALRKGCEPVTPDAGDAAGGAPPRSVVAAKALVAAMQLLRAALCRVAAADAHGALPQLLVPLAGAGGTSAAHELLLAAGCMHGLEICVHVLGDELSGLVAPTTGAAPPQQAQQAALAALLALGEAALRCLASVHSMQQGLAVLQRADRCISEAAAQLPRVVESAALTSLGHICDAADRCRDASTLQPAAPAVLAGCFDPLCSLAASACKLAQRCAAQPQLRRELWCEDGHMLSSCGAVEVYLMALADTYRSLPPAEQQGRRQRQLQAAALAALASVRAVQAVDEAEDAASRAAMAVRLLCFMLCSPAMAGVLEGEGALAEVAAAMPTLLASNDMDVCVPSALGKACQACPRLALAIFAQPGYAEAYGSTTTVDALGLLHPPTQLHGEVHHLIEHAAVQQLAEERMRRLAEEVHAMQSATSPQARLAAFRRHKLALGRQAAQQLAQQPPPRGPPGSEQERRALREREAALAARACGNLRCTRLDGASEAALPKNRKCSGCKTVRYCDDACAKQAWKSHKPACRLLAAQAQAL